MDFDTRAAAYLEAFQADMKQNFRLFQNAEYIDRRFPLYAMYEYEDTATLIMKNGKSVRSYEFCYFDVCAQLDETAIKQYINVLEDMAARYVPWSEPSHGYTMLSMVVLTDGLPQNALLKLVRRYKHEERRRRPEDGYGWCSCRLCIVDLSTGSYVCNSHGKELGNRVRLTTKKVSAR